MCAAVYGGGVDCQMHYVTENGLKRERMKKVLIYGLKEPVGGVEKIVLDYVRHIVKSGREISFDFLVFSKTFSFEAEIAALGCRVVHLPSKKDDYAYFGRIFHVKSQGYQHASRSG